MITAERVAVYERECLVDCPQSATGTIICRCLRISVEQICEAADSGCAVNVREITRQTGAGAGCTACHKRIRELLAARKLETARLSESSLVHEVSSGALNAGTLATAAVEAA